MKIITVVGARPQFIKAAVVSREIAKSPQLSEKIVHTGQHFDANMSDIFFSELEIPSPAFNLDIGGGTHGEMTGKMLIGIESILLTEKPNLVLIYGDTNSTLAGALAAAKLHIPVAHVEAGLRSFNKKMPEEVNRIVADSLSEKLFAPTEAALANLLHEGYPREKVSVVGDVMYDAALFYGAKSEKHSTMLHQLGLESGKYALATVHRAENTDIPQRLEAIFNGLLIAAKSTKVVCPLHPRTKKHLIAMNLFNLLSEKLIFTEPLGYLDMVSLEKNAAIIVTDSGGVQKEAFFYQVPCVTLRDQTEWVELVTSGWNKLISPTSAQIVAEGILGFIGGRGANIQPYGAGDAGQKIVAELLK